MVTARANPIRIAELVGVGNIDLGKAAGYSCVDGIYYTLNVWPNMWPLLLAENHNGDLSIRKVLLITNVLVGGQKELEPGLFRCDKQLAVLEFVPALLKSGAHSVPSEIRPDRHGRCLIEENSHLMA
jgi:hypothetical protein